MFIHSSSLQSREHVSGEKFLAEIFDNYLARTRGIGFLDYGFGVIALANVTHHRDGIVRIVFFQPWNDDRCVQSTGISENDFLRHERSLRAGGPRPPAISKEWICEHAVGFPPD